MNRKKVLIFLSMIGLVNLSSCMQVTSSSSFDNSSSNNLSSNFISNNSSSVSSYNEVSSTSEISSNSSYLSSSEVLKTYTIIWQNYNGEILEKDLNVPYGTIPTYDGEIPIREDNENISYIFSGWTPSISEVKEDKTYTAVFNEINNDNSNVETNPIVSEDKKIVEYGLYPQSYVSDATLIKELDSLSSSSINSWYFYNGSYYMKEKAKVYNNESYTFDDGVSIVNDNNYWFKCEPIKWNVLSSNNGTYVLLSSMLLDVHNFYKDYSNRIIDDETIYANSYEYSDIRSWLNNEFFNTAFALNKAYVQEKTIDNSSFTSDSIDNQYTCNSTNDKVYLPSYQDYLNSSYGFDSNGNNLSSTRECKTTDYARIRGAWCNTTSSLKYNGTYWTRSSSSDFYYCAWNVNSGGYLSAYAVDGENHCVRPCISISIVE